MILSDSLTDTKKIIARKVSIKKQTKWQTESFIGAQVFHKNIDFENLLELPFKDYKQITIEKQGETTIFSKTKTAYKFKTVANEVQVTVNEHNKQKNYLYSQCF